jgi:hypothetical protein
LLKAAIVIFLFFFVDFTFLIWKKKKEILDFKRLAEMNDLFLHMIISFSLLLNTNFLRNQFILMQRIYFTCRELKRCIRHKQLQLYFNVILWRKRTNNGNDTLLASKKPFRMTNFVCR